MKVSIVGAGAMGSALVIPLVDNGHDVALWGTEYDKSILTAIQNRENHPRINVKMPSEIEIYKPDELSKALDGTDLMVLGVSSGGVAPITEKIAPFVDDEVPLMTIAKGLLEINDNPYLIEEGVREILDQNGVSDHPPIACMGGPSIAQELAERSETAVGLAARKQEVAQNLAEIFDTSYFGLKATDDLSGLETCIGFKNMYSISLAWPSGMSERDGVSGMTNLKAILFLQTLKELKAITKAQDGNAETVMDLPGLGDLVTTSDAGRNGTLGRLLGSGHTTEEALSELERQGVGVVEGYETANLGRDFVSELENLSMHDLPLLREINRVLYDGKSVEMAMEDVEFFCLTNQT